MDNRPLWQRQRDALRAEAEAAVADDLFAVADQVECETRDAKPPEVQSRWWTPSPADTYATADGQWFPVRMALTVDTDHTAAWFMALNRGVWRIDTEPGPPTPETGWEYTTDGQTWNPLTFTTTVATRRGDFIGARCTTPLTRGRLLLVCHAQ